MTSTVQARPAPKRIDREAFGTLPDGRTIERVTLHGAGGVRVSFIGYGGAITEVHVPDRDGVLADVALGYGTLDAYVADEVWLGSLIGRYANRIARGRFTLDGVRHQLGLNHGSHHIHGGRGGFDRVTWEVEPFHTSGGAGAVLRHTSPAGTEGYPGTLFVEVTYTLLDTAVLVLDYSAMTTAPTPVNLTQHGYWNLAGEGSGDVLGHELTLHASRYTPVDAASIPTGELRAVAGTAFDFRAPTPLGARIAADDAQLRQAGGYDHNYVLDRAGEGLHLAARLYEPGSGRVLEVHTTEPGIQLYTGNALDGRITGKGGRPYGRHAGVALETQHFPDSPNQPRFPSTILRPGETFQSRTVYRFGVEG